MKPPVPQYALAAPHLNHARAVVRFVGVTMPCLVPASIGGRRAVCRSITCPHSSLLPASSPDSRGNPHLRMRVPNLPSPSQASGPQPCLCISFRLGASRRSAQPAAFLGCRNLDPHGLAANASQGVSMRRGSLPPPVLTAFVHRPP